MALSQEQRIRYGRNLLIPGFGEAGQSRLAAARVLVVGLGGLGSPVVQYLAGAGVGTLGLVDSDTVELSNLQRQVLHTMARLGQRKTDSAADAVASLNPEVCTERFSLRLNAENAGPTVSTFDVVVEATDNFETKFLLNDVCLEQRKPFATAGALALGGQALFVVPGQTPCLRCALPNTPKTAPSTAELGILGAVPGVLGSIQAMEVIRWLVGLWQPDADGSGRLHVLDGNRMCLRTLRIPRRPTCRCAGLWGG